MTSEERITQLEQTVTSLNELVKSMFRKQILMEIDSELDNLTTHALLATHTDLANLEKAWRKFVTIMSGDILERYKDGAIYSNGTIDTQLNEMVVAHVKERVTDLDISRINLWKEVRSNSE
ncbi:hypothetical protein [Serratia fonticola]|uniref:hypothetical protein n=1 Tax=Serratia fonticola TaxID=47917 RepID=UPI00137774F9|nr:hypothetical protein [Serratia fonticola]NCG55195.1 hypothetical protein [Serratia fonticola]